MHCPNVEKTGVSARLQLLGRETRMSFVVCDNKKNDSVTREKKPFTFKKPQTSHLLKRHPKNYFSKNGVLRPEKKKNNEKQAVFPNTAMTLQGTVSGPRVARYSCSQYKLQQAGHCQSCANIVWQP